MNFGDAIVLMKKGECVRRTGWNGKGMHLFLETFNGREPCVTMFTAQGTMQPGWLASQADMLAGDWEVVKQPY